MRRRPRVLSMGILAASVLAALGFAPAVEHVEPVVTTFTVGPAEVELWTDGTRTGPQPVVVEITDGHEAIEHRMLPERWLEQGYAYAWAAMWTADVAEQDRACGDLAGPQDRADVRQLVGVLTGAEPDDAGDVHSSLDGRIVLATELRTSDAALATVLDDDPVHVDGLAIAGGTLDPHDRLHSRGNVRLVDDPLTTVLTATLGDCAFPPAAQDPARTEFWTSRDSRDRLDRLTTPLLVQDFSRDGEHVGAGPEILAGLDRVDSPPTSWLHVSTPDQDVWRGTGRASQLLDGLVASAFGDAAGAAAMADEPRIGVDHDERRFARADVRDVRLHLNRTFEQDLGCAPVCVPPPGTGEVGSLEVVNRFTAPHAPVFTWVDAGVDDERLTADDPLNDGSGVAGVGALPGGHGYHSLAFRTGPAAADTIVHGSVELDGWFQTGSAGGTVTPILTATDPSDGTQRVIAYGAVDLDYAGSLAAAEHAPGWKRMRVRFDAVHWAFRAGEQLQLVLQSQASPFENGRAQGTVNVATGPVDGVTDEGSTVVMPVLTGGFGDVGG